jgi:hypothetical protein
VDGKPRADGARSFLASRGIERVQHIAVQRRAADPFPQYSSLRR